MRRLAVQTRDDSYSSNRDYQTVFNKVSHQIVTDLDVNRIILTKELIPNEASSTTIGFGGFLFPSSPVSIKLILEVNGHVVEQEYDLNQHWFRIGVAVEVVDVNLEDIKSVRVTLEWESSTNMSFWGLESDYLSHSTVGLDDNLATLNVSHLSPETYYLMHDTSVNMDFDEENSTGFIVAKGEQINLKKCSYCERELPINPEMLGFLSFHKHRAKVTKHQNECRACKKWRINDNFNPLRTTDQLHESSVITRERKILLREPIILQEIKERTGAGLKSQIWDKFNQRCFYCNEEVALDEFQLDHTRPLAYLWPIDEHATCLCAKHNNQKKDKFPIDFYNEEQLVRLAEITGLSYEMLCIKDVNEVELTRVLDDIVSFANEWDARTFFAIARKIKELRPDTDLLNLLKIEDETTFQSLVVDLKKRPDPVV